MSDKLFYNRYSDNSLTLMIDNKTFKFFQEDKEFIDDIENEILHLLNLKENCWEETFNDVKKHLIERLSFGSQYHKLKELVRNIDGVTAKEGNIYLEDSKVTVPEELVDLLSKARNIENLKSFINFWKLVSLNPNKQVRDDILQYVKDYGITITTYGYMVLYKAVEKVEKSTMRERLEEFVYTKFTEKQDDPDTNPHQWKVFIVVEKDNFDNIKEYTLIHESDIPHNRYDGYNINKYYLIPLYRLNKAYNIVKRNDSEDSLSFTPKYKGGNYANHIKLGKESSMPRENCDADATVGCSQGLHIGSFDYVSHYGYSDDTILCCLVNPINVVAIPNHDNSKIRTCKYYPYGIMERDNNGNWEEFESNFFEEDYKDKEIKQLTDMDITELDDSKKQIVHQRLDYLK